MMTLNLFILLFADDVVLLSTSKIGLIKAFKAFTRFCTAHSMKISEKKTKILVNDKGLKN